MNNSNIKTENEGLVYIYDQITKMGFIWRDFLRHDIGIDLTIELFENKTPTGLLIAAQIKSGDSYFSKSQETVIVPISYKKLNYWMSYSLPVIIIVYSKSRNTAYWKQISLDVINDFNIQKCIKFHCSEDNLFNSSISSSLLSIAKDHRNRAKGFSLSYRSKRDEDNLNRWVRIKELLLELKYRTSPDFLKGKVMQEITDFEEEEESNITDMIFDEIGFISDLLKWDTIAKKYNQPLKFDKAQFDDLKNVLLQCRSQWKGNYLEKWLLKSLGWLNKDWHDDVKELYLKYKQYISSDISFCCPICISDDYTEIENNEFSYKIAYTFHDVFEVYAKCNVCNSYFFYTWGGSGKINAT